jgi:hypothetical protein
LAKLPAYVNLSKLMTPSASEALSQFNTKLAPINPAPPVTKIIVLSLLIRPE